MWQYKYPQAILNIVDSMVTALPAIDKVDFKVYPNPVSDVLHVSLDNPNIGHTYLRLTDSFGKLYWSGSYTTNEILIPVSHYPRGVYILELRTPKGRYARPVVIQ
ncbi:MAG: T9SS type A sorting domain-containing protein [Saprospiraceae bacterium]|nr:T9SS type A sorting domain-containing protein [Candidatus Opimibacter skivensis]